MTVARLSRLGTQPWFALALVGCTIGVFLILVPHATAVDVDHRAFLGAVRKMKHGQDYYSSWTESYRENQQLIGCSMNFRPPIAFYFWSLFPIGWLYGLFIVVVVVGTAAVVAFNTRWPLLAVPVAAYLLHSGRTSDRHGEVVDRFLLVELWVVPLIAVGFLLIKYGRQWAAAVLAVVVPSVRELGIVLVAGGGLGALWRHRPKLLWMVAGATVVGIYAWHLSIGGRHLSGGECVELFGSGRPPTSVLAMMDFPIPGTVYIGLAIWLVALTEVIFRGDGPLALPTLAVPLLGFFVDRGYWGHVCIPFMLWWAAEGIMRVYFAWRSGDGLTRASLTAAGVPPLLPAAA
jgi:hypothetical protein